MYEQYIKNYLEETKQIADQISVEIGRAHV